MCHGSQEEVSRLLEVFLRSPQRELRLVHRSALALRLGPMQWRYGHQSWVLTENIRTNRSTPIRKSVRLDTPGKEGSS